MGALSADLRDLVEEVAASVPRLLALQDKDPDSPSRGCLHPAYWRDKSSEVADMRRQEATLAFAWLWKHPLPGNRWQGNREVLLASLRALGFWTREQHPDGTFDEWYKNEHGYATTAFSSYAVALTVEALGDDLAGPLRAAVLRALRKCGDWLATHDDWFKTNHQAVGVAALGAIGRVLEETRFGESALRNAQNIIDRMNPEGWSREISGFDIGYTFLLAEYLAMHAVLTGEMRFIPAIAKAYAFATEFLHPDLTTGAEYGICANPYFSRVATVALAPHCSAAAAALRWMDREASEPRDTSSTLKDDLRLARYAYQPLLAALLQLGLLRRKDQLPASVPGSAPLAFETVSHNAHFKGAKLLAICRPGYAAWVGGVYGGFVRMAFRSGDGFTPAVSDRGYVYDLGRSVYRTARWSLDAEFDFAEGVCTIEVPFLRCAFVQPPYWARVGLHMATSLPYGPRWTRWAIDQWRKRKGTALNQSTAGISGGRSPFRLKRTIRMESDHVVITDEISGTGAALDLHCLHMVHDGSTRVGNGLLPNEDRRIAVSRLGLVPTASSRIQIRKQWHADQCRIDASD